MSPQPSFAAVVLAAGQGTRMKSPLPKPLLPLLGRPMVRYVLDALRAAGADPVVVVTGHQAERVAAALPPYCRTALQSPQRGTGHALQCAEPVLADYHGRVLVCYADCPLLTSDTFTGLLAHHDATRAGATLLSMKLPDGASYGRIVRHAGDGRVQAIVEAADCTPEQRAIREVNAGVYVFPSPEVFAVLRQVQADNAKGELYLTDAVALLVAAGARVEAVVAADPGEALGVNTPQELLQAEEALRRRGVRQEA